MAAVNIAQRHSEEDDLCKPRLDERHRVLILNGVSPPAVAGGDTA